jgi:energy-coupling factor transport system permease protein
VIKSLNNLFAQYHPAANFLYIAAAVFCGMYTLRPACVALSFICASSYSIFLNGWGAYVKALKLLAIMFVIIALFNPLTNHRGMTELFHLFGNQGWPITLEAFIYGICSGGMLVSVFVWFQCYQALITTDKFMYLFGRAAPTSAMVMSMILKLVPVTIRKYHYINEAQFSLYASTSEVDRRGRVRNAVRVSGVLLGRTLEDSIETADSMRARGYGSGKRTRFTIYRFAPGDIMSIAALAILLVIVVVCITLSNGSLSFFPIIRAPKNITLDAILFASYALLLFYPFIIEARSAMMQFARRCAQV